MHIAPVTSKGRETSDDDDEGRIGEGAESGEAAQSGGVGARPPEPRARRRDV